MLRTSEITDIFNTFDEIYFVFTEKSKYPLSITCFILANFSIVLSLSFEFSFSSIKLFCILTVVFNAICSPLSPLKFYFNSMYLKLLIFQSNLSGEQKKFLEI